METANNEAPFCKRTLAEATVQEIQLELIRRTRFNAFDGQRVLDALMRHRELWRAVILDRVGLQGAVDLSRAGLIKLRDLPHNHWNADTLIIMTSGPEAARQLERAIEEEDWGGMVMLHEDCEELSMALGGKAEYPLIRVWWD
jgi:hypothetical protein